MDLRVTTPEGETILKWSETPPRRGDIIVLTNTEVDGRWRVASVIWDHDGTSLETLPVCVLVEV